MKRGCNGGRGVRQRGRFKLGVTNPYFSGTRGSTSTPYCRLGLRVPEHASSISMTWAACRCRRDSEAIMEVIFPHCAGLDVHKQTVVACVALRATVRRCSSSHLRHHDLGPAGPGRLARLLRRRACRHGSHRRLLEAGVARARRPLRADPGQRRACEKRTRPQDRCQRRDVAGGLAGPRADPCQLRAARGGAGIRTLTRTRKQFVASELPMCSASTRCSRTPTSSSVSCSATSWARAGARCCRPSSTVTPIPNGWPRASPPASRPAAPNCSKPARAHQGTSSLHAQGRLTTSMRSIRRSPPSRRRWVSGSNRFDKPPGC